MFFHHPDMPTLGILRLDTESGPWFCMVTKQILQMLSEELAKKAELT